MALMGFHAGQLAFGGVLWVWAPIMLVALGLLLRAELRADDLDERPKTPLGVDRPLVSVGTVEGHK